MTEKIITQRTPSEAKVVTALQKLLMQNSLEDLLIFMQQLGVRFSISGNIPGKHRGSGYHRCSLFIDGYMKYTSTNNMSARGAMCSAMAAFLVMEQHDFHIYKGLVSSQAKTGMQDETVVTRKGDTSEEADT